MAEDRHPIFRMCGNAIDDDFTDNSRLIAIAQDLTKSEHERKRARDRLIRANLGLVVKQVVRTRGHQTYYDEYLSAGLEGLNEAITRFDLSLDLALSTYAYWWIKQRIQSEQANLLSLARMPRYIWQRLSNVAGACSNLREKALPVTNENIAEQLGWSVDRLNEFRGYFRDVIQIDTPVYRDKDKVSALTYAEIIPGSEDLWDVQIELESREILAKLLGHLDDDIRYVLESIFIEEKPRAQIAADLGIKATQVTNLKRSGLRKLRTRGAKNHLGDDLETVA